MTAGAVAKKEKSSVALKDHAAIMRHHFDALDRAREIYLNQMKRAEADYNERIQTAMKLLAGQAAEETEEAVQAPAEQPTQ